MDGSIFNVPLKYLPILNQSTEQERNSWELCGNGFAIRWPELNNYILTASELIREFKWGVDFSSWFLVLSFWLGVLLLDIVAVAHSNPSLFVRQLGGGEGALAGKFHFDEVPWAEGVKKRGN